MFTGAQARYRGEAVLSRVSLLLKRARGIDRLIIAGMQTEHGIDCRAAHDLGNEMVLVGDGHSTFDFPVLTGARIVAHHHRVLSGNFVRSMNADSITF